MWFWLTLIYLFFLVTAQVVNKKALNNLEVDEVVFGASVQVATAVVSFILAIITGWKFEFNSDSIPIFILMGVTYFFAVSLYYTGLKNIDLSLTSILDSFGAIFSLFLGLFLIGEQITINKVLGIIFILISTASIFIKSKAFRLNKFSVILVISAFFYALGAIWDKKLNTFGNPLSYLTLSFATAGISMLLVYYKRTIKAVNGTFKYSSFWYGILTNGILYSIGFWALFEAYNRGGEVSRMFPITLSGSVLIPLAGIIILKERDDVWRKLIAVIIMVIGLYFIGK